MVGVAGEAGADGAAGAAAAAELRATHQLYLWTVTGGGAATGSARTPSRRGGVCAPLDWDNLPGRHD